MASAATDKIQIPNKIELRQLELLAASPNSDRQIGADACRLAQCQRQWKAARSAHYLFLYSIIADLRISSRNFFDSDSKRLVKSCSRTSRFSGDSAVVSFLLQTANICSPCAVTSGAVRCPTSMFPRISRNWGVRSAELRVIGSRIATSRKARAIARPSLHDTNRTRRLSAIPRLAEIVASFEPRGTTMVTG